jgi:hypothetical protein
LPSPSLLSATFSQRYATAKGVPMACTVHL